MTWLQTATKLEVSQISICLKHEYVASPFVLPRGTAISSPTETQGLVGYNLYSYK